MRCIKIWITRLLVWYYDMNHRMIADVDDSVNLETNYKNIGINYILVIIILGVCLIFTDNQQMMEEIDKIPYT